MLTTQQQLVLEQNLRMLERSSAVGDHLDSKAALVFQSGALITGLLGAVSIPTFAYNPASWWQLVAMTVAFLAFAGMLALALRAWWPSKFSHPGALDWDETFTAYIDVAEGNCYNQVLSDTKDVLSDMLNRNRDKAYFVNAAAFLLLIQVAAILILALLTTQTVFPIS